MVEQQVKRHHNIHNESYTQVKYHSMFVSDITALHRHCGCFLFIMLVNKSLKYKGTLLRANLSCHLISLSCGWVFLHVAYCC